MNTSTYLARAAIVGAVSLQAMGKVAYGTWLHAFPTATFVFISFTLTAEFFNLSRHRVDQIYWPQIILLNGATMITFLSFFYALKVVEPAIVGAVEIGVGPVFAILLALFLKGEIPTLRRFFVSAGILGGCAILAVAALKGSGYSSPRSPAWLGLLASISAGAGAVLITTASKSLLEKGWHPNSVLAHRFYLILPASLILALSSDNTNFSLTSEMAVMVVVVSVISVLAPLYLLQVGIRRCDPYTVMVTMAALPLLTFLVEGLSPMYTWSWLTAIGLAVVMLFLLADLLGRN